MHSGSVAIVQRFLLVRHRLGFGLGCGLMHPLSTSRMVLHCFGELRGFGFVAAKVEEEGIPRRPCALKQGSSVLRPGFFRKQAFIRYFYNELGKVKAGGRRR